MPRLIAIACVFIIATSVHASALSPPMLDIARQCGAANGHDTNAMSECVVAESEARSEVLQRWGTLDEPDTERCVKLSRKARRLPYTALARCMTAALGSRAGPLVEGQPNASK